jgi:hypothetical protein
MPARCPECGAELARADEPPAAVSYTPAEPRLFGVFPPVAVLVVALALVLGGVIALALGKWLWGAALVLLAVPLLVLYAGDARRDPASPPVRLTAAAFDRARGRATYAGTALRAWIEAGGHLVELRVQLKRLRRERQRAIDALGVAAYRKETKEMTELRKRLAALDDAIAERERAARDEVEHARAEVASSRLPVNATRELSRR